MKDNSPENKTKKEDLTTNVLAMYIAQSYLQLASEPLTAMDPVAAAKKVLSVARKEGLSDTVVTSILRAVLRPNEVSDNDDSEARNE